VHIRHSTAPFVKRTILASITSTYRACR
jgi:hypothetical protein